jgi:hypothetical protein
MTTLSMTARSRAWLLPVVAVVISVLAPRPARAQFIINEGSDNAPEEHYHSPQNFAFQLTFGPYRPDVDSEFSSGRHPYADYFHSDRHLLSQIELDYQFFQRVGSVAVGLSVGYFSVSGQSPPADRSATQTADTSTLKVVPTSISAIYRFDYYLKRNNIPLVPHAKIGLDYAYWQNTDGNGEIAHAQGGTARGGTLGWHAALGLALVLDMLDPDAARSFDTEMGVNHTALVFEYGHYDISGLGESNRLHLGDTTWTLGLLLEF